MAELVHDDGEGGGLAVHGGEQFPELRSVKVDRSTYPRSTDGLGGVS